MVTLATMQVRPVSLATVVATTLGPHGWPMDGPGGAAVCCKRP
jgi:hypothetical protein